MGSTLSTGTILCEMTLKAKTEDTEIQKQGD